MSVSRPASARPRSDSSANQGAQLAPSEEELTAIEDHRVAWAGLLGATVEDDQALRGRLVTHGVPGSSLNYVAGMRWDADRFDEQLNRAVGLMSD